MKWTEEMNAEIVRLRDQGMTIREASLAMNVPYTALKGHTLRAGISFDKYMRLHKETVARCHKAADERSAQLLREAGFEIYA